MLGLFTRKKLYREEAIHVFEHLQRHARNPLFYSELKVPDTTEGRFDILTLHIFMMIERMKKEPAGPAFSQALFDIAFESIDQGYREIGVGDMGVPKRMKKLMMAFNGRLHAYMEAYSKGDRAGFADALDRNIYDRVHFAEGENIPELMTDYSFGILDHLHSIEARNIIEGRFELSAPKGA